MDERVRGGQEGRDRGIRKRESGLEEIKNLVQISVYNH